MRVEASVLFVCISFIVFSHFASSRRCLTRDYHPRDREHEELVASLMGTDSNASYESYDVKTVIQVIWNVIHDRGRGRLQQDVIKRNIKVLNADFSQTPFSFELVSVRYAENRSWFEDWSEDIRLHREMRIALRQGDATTLNVYSGSSKTKGDVLGYSSMPSELQRMFLEDGVFINEGTVPGGDLAMSNMGRTLTHEVGHWLGLFHIFQGGCSYPNDFVRDTRPMRFSSSGCPRPRSSCIRANFEYERDIRMFEYDQIHIPFDQTTNFMDYSADICLTEFTPGQVARMKAQWVVRKMFDQSRRK